MFDGSFFSQMKLCKDAEGTLRAVNVFMHSYIETQDANDANKSRYSREVGRLNILSLLASFARNLGFLRVKFTTQLTRFVSFASGVNAPLDTENTASIRCV